MTSGLTAPLLDHPLPALCAPLQTLMQALLVLEGMIRPEFLKQQWRPFAMPAPHPDDICKREQRHG